MKKSLLFLVSLFLVVGIAHVGEAQVNININVGPPPPLHFAGPPDVVVVPSGTSDVYLVPNTVGLYFYGGYWYRFHHDHWFRASIYSDPWVSVSTSLVPAAVVVIPPDYILGLPPRYHRIHYNDFHRHWRDWGHNHHWHNQHWYKDHSRNHWGGREFHHGPPPPHHDRNAHRKSESHHDRGILKDSEGHHGGDAHKSSSRGHEDGPHHDKSYFK